MHFVKNTDDHLRNHGFLLTSKGWRLEPMFDVNPNPDGGEHALDMGDLIKDAEYYRLSRAEAQAQYGEIQNAVRRLGRGVHVPLHGDEVARETPRLRRGRTRMA